MTEKQECKSYNIEDTDYSHKFIAESITDIKNGRTVFVYKQRVLDRLIMTLEEKNIYYEARKLINENCWEVNGNIENAIRKQTTMKNKSYSKRKG